MAGPQTDGSLFWDLPLELRFFIYGFAYGTGRTITPTWIHTSLELKTLSRKLTAVKQKEQLQNGEKTIDEVRLVSKQFHAEAMQHLVENNTFRFSRLLGGLRKLSYVSSQFARGIRSLVIDWHGFTFPDKLDLNQLCPKLQHLTIALHFEQLEEDSFVRASGPPTDNVLRKCSIAVALSMVRGLSHFTIDGSPAYYQVNTGSTNALQKNRVATSIMKALEEVLRSIVTREPAKPRFPRAAKKSRLS
ncbi:hypothetical protein TI39_contig4250g00007 [Zymoseptoria brevis]|uniref:Uncharacterized protein n=1 Tax=Zymoseptoria brevis TaxID=1047168 RepID=A0A0F4G907_9PEZI|nr:hypothetical protein TI39_contig4250g00007 [Zymoseptoria brevis]